MILIIGGIYMRGSISVLEKMAHRYNQLYLDPESGVSETGIYSDIVKYGVIPTEISEKIKNGLNGFKCSENDKYFSEITPVGKIEILYIHERSDFERFIQIMAYRGEPAPVAENIDVVEIDGITNWRKIERHMDEYFINGGNKKAWQDELINFQKDKKNYQDDLIVVTDCNYGGLSYDKTGYSEFLWKEISLKMNIYSSCTRMIRRRLYPESNNSIWAEITVDCIGMLFAINKFDPDLEKKILGISKTGYDKKGKLSLCVNQKNTNLNDLSVKLTSVIGKICTYVKKLIDSGCTDYYDILPKLEEKKDNYISLFEI